MKVFPSLLAALVLLIAVAGCGGDDDDEGGERAATTGTETTATAETATAETAEPEERERAERRDDDRGGSGDDGGSSGGGSSSGGGGGGASGDEGSPADRKAVTDVVLGFHRALSDGDGDEACSLLAGSTREQIEKSIERAPQLKGRSCSQVIEIVAKNYPERVKEALGDVKIRKISFDGDRARVGYKVGDLPATTMPLAREDGKWRVAALAGSSG